MSFSLHLAFASLMPTEKLPGFGSTTTEFVLTKDIFKDEEEIKNLKAERAEMSKLIKRLQVKSSKDEKKELPKLNSYSIKDVRVYEKAARKELFDSLKILNDAKKIIESEYIHVIQDIRRPFIAYEQIKDSLKIVLTGKKIDSKSRLLIEGKIQIIELNFHELLEEIMNLLNNDFNYLAGRGIQFKGFIYEHESEENLGVHIRKRTLIRRQIVGKTQALLREISQAKSYFVKLKKQKKITSKIANPLIDALDIYMHKFSDLIRLCFDRTKIATTVIIESLTIQRKVQKDILKLQKELNSFYDKFMRRESNLIKESESDYLNSQRKKRIKEFENYQKNVLSEMKKFEKEITKKITSVSKKESKTFKLEARELKCVKGRIARTMAKVALVTTLISSTVGVVGFKAAHTDNSQNPRMELAYTNKKVTQQGCAEWIIDTYARTYSLGKDYVTDVMGVSGNAWTMKNNIIHHKGSLIFDVFDTINAQNKTTIDSLRMTIASEANTVPLQMKVNKKYAGEIRKLFSDSVNINLNNLKVGDVVGLFYPTSNYQVVAFMNGTAGSFNTHAGLVTSVDTNGVTISHNIHHTIYHDNASKLTSVNKHGLIVWVARPNNITKSLFTQNISTDLMAEYNSHSFKIEDNSLVSKESMEFVLGLESSQDTLQSYLGLSNSEMSMITKLAFGIFGRETSFGRGKMFYLEKAIDNLSLRMLKFSRGPTQIVLDQNFSKAEMNKFGISRYNIYDNKIAALATILVLGKNYKIMKEIAKESGKNFSAKDMEKLVVLSYNYGARVVDCSRPGAILSYNTKSIKSFGRKISSEGYYVEVIKAARQLHI